MSRLLVLLLLLLSGAARAQEISLEYQVKAAYLFNFAKFVDWRGKAAAGPLVICVAGHNPFGNTLAETIRDETINNRPLQMRVILEPEMGCHVLFIPDGSPASAYLRAAHGTPTVTVGETPDFIEQGGIIRFFIEQGKVRFEIDADSAERDDLHISSRLLRLGRDPEKRGAK